jgi:SAM-dependent methyltransferase
MSIAQEASQSRLEHVACGLCGADDAEVIYEARYDREKDADLVSKFRASGDELLIDRLVRCRRCQLQYVNPRLAAPLILESYAEGEDPTYVSQLAAREQTFDRALRKIERLAPRKGRLLDIGTAAGAFLGVAKRRGWDVEGCEPNRWLAAWGSRRYGIPIRSGDLFEQRYEPASFNVITLWDVIEHTPDPAKVIARCAQLLAPGGLLIVNYPDIDSAVARAMGRRWLFLTSVHLYYFTPTTIRALLGKAGFAVEEISRHVQSLELEYILSRGSVLSPGLARAACGLARGLKIGKLQVPYWLGQTFVAARKRP